jgi:lipopolysaccharide assembly protein A
MRVVTWTIRLAVFVVLIAFGARNADPVTLRFYFDLAWQMPLIVALFGAFALGALFGVAALLGTLFRQRRQISLLRRASQSAEQPPSVPPSVPPSFPPTVPPI